MRRTMYLVVLLVLGLLLSPSPSAQTTQQPGSQPGTQTGQQMGTETEKPDYASMSATEFLEHAMMGNMAEIRLGKLAAERGSSSQVKQFAQQMIEGHTKANEQVKKVAEQKGVQEPKELDAKHKEVEDRLSSLSGAEFDRAYMEHMVKDHQEDVDAFTAQSKNSKDESVRNLASTLLPDLQKHLQMATDTRQQVGGRAE